MKIPWDIHWSWAHQGPEDLEAFRAMEPGAIWILNPCWEIVRQAHEACPDALIVLRDQPQGEQHDFMRADPVGCARAHMADWLRHIPEWAPGIGLAQLAVCGINEGLIDTLEREVAVCTYYTELVELGTEKGDRGGGRRLRQWVAGQRRHGYHERYPCPLGPAALPEAAGSYPCGP